MYKITVPFTDYNNKPRNIDVTFNLEVREVFKMLPELQSVFTWIQANRDADTRDLTTEEVRDFYNSLEGIILEAYGELSDDGLHFQKSTRFEFEESKTFAACMLRFVTEPQEAVKLLEALLPKEMFEKFLQGDVEGVKKAQDEEKDKEIERLKAELAAKPVTS